MSDSAKTEQRAWISGKEYKRVTTVMPDGRKFAIHFVLKDGVSWSMLPAHRCRKIIADIDREIKSHA